MSSRRRLAAAALAAALMCLCASSAAAQMPPPLLYSSQDAASVVLAGAPGATGFPEALRQGPARPEEWPPRLVLGKVSGADLSRMSADRMAALLSAELRSSPAGVGVDELLPRDWTAGPNRALADALGRLGPDASRVVLYISPAFVSRIGGVDPSQALNEDLASLVSALRVGGVAMLEMYHADPRSTPLTEAEYAAYPTRWVPRFPGDDVRRIRLMFGPDRGIGQSAVWGFTRATPAGRQLLANGPAAYGLRTADEGRDWLSAYRDFLANPSTSPTGVDAVVPSLGGLRVVQAGPRALRLTATLKSRIVIQLLPARGGPRRVIGPFFGPVRNRLIIVPPRLAAGRYSVLAIAFGERLREEARAQITLRAPTG